MHGRGSTITLRLLPSSVALLGLALVLFLAFAPRECWVGYQCGTAPDWLMVAAAGMAAWVAWKQLRSAAQSISLQANVAKATLLLEIDREFESSEMLESRRALRALRNQMTKMAERQSNDTNRAVVQPLAAALTSQYLNQLWKDFTTADDGENLAQMSAEELVSVHLSAKAKPSEDTPPKDKAGPLYQRLTRTLGWLETVGYMCNSGLLPEDDIIPVYDFVFKEILEWTGGHIAYRRADGTPPNPDWMKEAEKFRDRVVALEAARFESANKKSKWPWVGTPTA